MDINKVILSGNVLGDSVVSTTLSGAPVCDFRLCVNNPKRNPTTGKWETNLVLVNCFVYGNAADVAGRQIQKGRHVTVEGSLYSSWTEVTGERRYHTHVDVSTFDVYGR